VNWASLFENIGELGKRDEVPLIVTELNLQTHFQRWRKPGCQTPGSAPFIPLG
jgi:hypothetical protein